MILPQPPAFPIILYAQAVSAADMTVKGFSAIAAIAANHIIGTHRLTHRYSGSRRRFRSTRLSKLTQSPMTFRVGVG